MTLLKSAPAPVAVFCYRVAKKRPCTDTRVEAAVGEAQNRIYTNCRVVHAAGEAQKGEVPSAVLPPG